MSDVSSGGATCLRIATREFEFLLALFPFYCTNFPKNRFRGTFDRHETCVNEVFNTDSFCSSSSAFCHGGLIAMYEASGVNNSRFGGIAPSRGSNNLFGIFDKSLWSIYPTIPLPTLFGPTDNSFIYIKATNPITISNDIDGRGALTTLNYHGYRSAWPTVSSWLSTLPGHPSTPA